ncbi:type II secretion system F family protein [Nocardiopsis sp. HNM0947]|uniref:Type II secretion system F family protein n=1 Tax=Nocardiopsis coralli TaxID=2772213 RepID=A0ABR9PDM2_9ACTN|nr:type II secretion system F family protein [Nocardiopsis coralli]MBE3001850.1 type II secretion system F family protein [Nocardiopsis coralli]
MVVLLVCLAGVIGLALLPRAHPALLRSSGGVGFPRVADLWERWHDRVRAARRGGERRRAVITLCRTLAAELRAGQPPEEALRLAVLQAGPAVGAVSDAASLRTVAESDPDLAALSYLAVCWDVAAETGAGLATVVDGLAENLTEQEEQRAEALARTAGPRTTAFVLSGLPVVGVLMSGGLGGSPLAFLFTTPLGLACLVGGVALDVLGVWWTVRMLRGAVATR